MSQRLNLLAVTDNDLNKHDSLLIIEQAPHIIQNLRTRINCLQRREVTDTLKNKKKASKAQVESASRDFIPDSSEATKTNGESAYRNFIPDMTKRA